MMSLRQSLAAMKAASKTPEHVKAKMDAATAELRASGILERVIKPGMKAPDFSLKDQNGTTVGLAGLLAGGAVVLTVFRGFW
ncbi:MAG: hypothetical protein HYR63_05330 [Proteobacteria bacterium]|nr:hypothetical protein [Pseudomonadota bacterium]MBI3495882.1 hypothetical protein [Pseudomonadota bacterium]